MMNRRTYLTFSAVAIAGLLGGCSTLNQAAAPQLNRDASWTVFPFENHTETPMAGQRAEAIAFAILQSRNPGHVRRFGKAPTNTNTLFAETITSSTMESNLSWAKENGINYALMGSVEEWRYKVGIDGEPAVGLTLHIIDVDTGAIVWSGTGAKSGWSRSALTSVAQDLIRDLLNTGLKTSVK